MPGLDKKGPMGQGPMTGRGQGYFGVPGDYGRPRYFGFGGFGHGWRNRYFTTGIPGRFFGRWFNRFEPESLSAQEKVKLLQNEANYFEQELNNIREEIVKLEEKDTKV